MPPGGLPRSPAEERDRAYRDCALAAADLANALTDVLRGELPEAIAEALRVWTSNHDRRTNG
jgi:hypothetical protein